MTRRFVSVWLSRWPTDQWRRRNRDQKLTGPLVLTLAGQGGIRLHAVDPLASADGLRPGLLLADARALAPSLTAVDADPAADRAALARLAVWAQRYTPQAASDGPDGLILDITGCAHLWGGEAGLLADLSARLGKAGFTHHLGLGDGPAAAWGWARHRPAGSDPILPEGKRAWTQLLPLPMAALRLDDTLVADLARVGLVRVGDAHRQHRAPLTARYGTGIGRRLDRMLGLSAEPVAPEAAPPLWRARLSFAEPIATREGIEAATLSLLRDLCGRLEGAGRGARRLLLTCFRTDASVQSVTIGAARPSRDAPALLKLFRERFDQVEPGFGIEMMEMNAISTDAFTAEQAGLAVGGGDAFALASLLDRLVNRLGEDRVGRPTPRDTHRPERIMELAGEMEGDGAPLTLTLPSAGADGPLPLPQAGEGRTIPASSGPSTACGRGRGPSPKAWEGEGEHSFRSHQAGEGEPVPASKPAWPKAAPRRLSATRARIWRMEGPRPLLLLHPPERVEVTEPALLSWRGQPLRLDWLEGPERIRPDWWQARTGPTRDYYRAQLADGRRVWLFRTADDRGHWYLHGLCA